MNPAPATTEAIRFVKMALRPFSSRKGTRILQVGCGEGQFAREFSDSWYDVTGIDASAEKIAVALEFEQEHLHFYTHDIRLPFHINYFDYALSLFSNFGVYRTDREHSNAIRSIANSIKHQGFLLLDYNNNGGKEATRLTLGDFNDMFAYHGLQMEEVFGDYELNAYDVKKSPRLIMIARKK